MSRAICVVGRIMTLLHESPPSSNQCIFLELLTSLDCVAKEDLQYEDLSSTKRWLTYFAEMSDCFLSKLS